MAFPILHRLLFGNDGAGPKLRSDILPDNALVSDAQTLTDAQKTQVQANLGVTASADTVTLSTAQTIAGAKTFGAPVTARDSLSVDGGITAGGLVKGARIGADNGVNTDLDFTNVHDSKGGGWFLSGAKHTSGDWTEIATVNSKVAKAAVADSAKYVEVGQVNGLKIGATTYSRSATSSGITFSVQASRDAYGRLSGLTVGTSGSVNCDCNCNCNCDCADSDTDG